MAENIKIEISADAIRAIQAANDVAKSLAGIGAAAKATTSTATSALDTLQRRMESLQRSSQGATQGSASGWRTLANTATAEAAKLEHAAERSRKAMAGMGSATAGAMAQQAAQLRAMASTATAEAAKLEAAAKRSTSALATTISTMVRWYGIWEAVRLGANLIETTRQLQDVTKRMEGATQVTGNFAGAMEFLTRTSAEHHKTIADMADGYARLLALEENGIVTRREAETITKGLSNAQTALGATNDQLRQAMFGLGQALASPITRAEELNQVTEPLPGLLAKMDKAAGLAAGGFRSMVNEGKVTSAFFKDVLIRALQNYEGAAEKAKGTITAAANDMRREWELLAQAADKPITFVVTATTGAAEAALRGLRTKAQQANEFWSEAASSVGAAWNRTFGLSADEIRANENKRIEQMLAERARQMDAAAAANSPAALLARYAEKSGVPLKFLNALVMAESSFQHIDPGTKEIKRSGKGALGLMQLMPDTARRLGVNPFDLEGNIAGGTQLIGDLWKKYDGDWRKVAAAYNMGEPRFDKRGLANLFDETKEYVERIGKLLKESGSELATKFLSIEDYKKGLGERESLFRESLERQVSVAESAARSQQAALETAQAALSAGFASRRVARATALVALPMSQRAGQELINEKAAAQDAIAYAREKQKLDLKSIDIEEKLARQKLASLQADLQKSDEFERQADKRADLTTKIAAAEAELQTIAERRKQAELSGQTAINEALAKEVEAVDAAKRARMSLNDETISRYQKLASAQAQTINAQLDAGIISQVEARQRLTAVNVRLAASIKQAVEDQKEFAKTSTDPAIAEAAERAQLAWIEATAAIRTPIEGMVVQWQDAMGSMEQASVQWAEGFADLLADVLATGKAEFGDFVRAIQRDLANIFVRGMLAGIYKEFGGMSAGGAGGGLASVFTGSGGGAGMGSVLSLATTGRGSSLGSSIFSGSNIATGGSLASLLGGSMSMEGAGWLAGNTLRSGLMNIGVGSTAATSVGSFVGSGVQFSPYGAIGGLIANALGLGSKNQYANMGLTTAGGFLGGAAGATLVGGSFGGPVGAIIGAIIGALASDLIKVATPAAGSELRFGRDNSVTPTYQRKHAGGDLEGLNSIGYSLANSFGKLEKALDVEFGKLYIMTQQKGTKLRIAGADDRGTFYEQWGKFKDADIARMADQFTIAMVKRQYVIKQIDDKLKAGAVMASNTGEDLANNIKRYMRIREYENERTALDDDLAAIGQQYSMFRGSVIRFTNRRNRQAELEKLDAAYQRQFDTRAVAFRDAFAQFGGRDTTTAAYALDQLSEQRKRLESQNNALDRAARKSGTLSYVRITEGEFEAAYQSAVNNLKLGVRKALREAMGYPAELLSEQLAVLGQSFERIRADAQALGMSIEEVDKAYVKAEKTLRRSQIQPTIDKIAEATQNAIDAMVGPAATIERLSVDIGAKTAMLSAFIDPAEQQAEILKIRDLVAQRYELELQSVQDLIVAGKNLKAVVSGLRTGGLSPYSQQEQAANARERYLADLAGAMKREPEAAASLATSGQAYLQSLTSIYALGSPEYRKQFEDVTNRMDALGVSIGDDGAQRLRELQAETNRTLEGLQVWLEKQARVVDEQRQAQETVGQQVAGALAPVFDSLGRTLGNIDRTMAAEERRLQAAMAAFGR